MASALSGIGTYTWPFVFKFGEEGQWLPNVKVLEKTLPKVLEKTMQDIAIHGHGREVRAAGTGVRPINITIAERDTHVVVQHSFKL